MNIWEILGTEPTTDISMIKAAYARLVKEHSPEDEPEKFKEIFSAYKAACSYAKAASKGIIPAGSIKVITFNDNVPDKKETEPEKKDDTYSFDGIKISLNERPRADTGSKALLDSINALLSDKLRRESINKWRELLESPVFAAAAGQTAFRYSVSAMLEGQLFSPKTARYIAKAFGKRSYAKRIRLFPEKWKVYISGGISEPVVSPLAGGKPGSATASDMSLIILVCLVFFVFFTAYIVFFIKEP